MSASTTDATAGWAETELRLSWATDMLRVIVAQLAKAVELAKAGLDLATADEAAMAEAGNDDALEALAIARRRLPPHATQASISDPPEGHVVGSGQTTRAAVEAGGGGDGLREALAEVMEWISRWGPPMVQFDGWADVDRRARVALARSSGNKLLRGLGEAVAHASCEDIGAKEYRIGSDTSDRASPHAETGVANRRQGAPAAEEMSPYPACWRCNGTGSVEHINDLSGYVYEQGLPCPECAAPALTSPQPAQAAPAPAGGGDRDYGGRLVCEAWVRWALTQPNPKPTWLVPYDELSEPDKEADRQIAEALWAVRAPTPDAPAKPEHPLFRRDDEDPVEYQKASDRAHAENDRLLRMEAAKPGQGGEGALREAFKLGWTARHTAYGDIPNGMAKAMEAAILDIAALAAPPADAALRSAASELLKAYSAYFPLGNPWGDKLRAALTRSAPRPPADGALEVEG